MTKLLAGLAIGLSMAFAVQAQSVQVNRVGHVDVATSDKQTKALGVFAVEDPHLRGVVCYLPGGPVNALACSSRGPVVLPPNLPAREVLVEAGKSPGVRNVSLVRLVDQQRKSLIYMAYMEIPPVLTTEMNGKTTLVMAVVPYVE